MLKKFLRARAFARLSSVCILFVILLSCERLNERAKKNHDWITSEGKLKILSTTAMINDLVQEIAKEHAITITLIQGNLDPHSYQLVKGDDEKLSAADLIFYNGLGLEHGASLQHNLESNPKAIALGNLVQKQYPEEIFYVDKQIDPHIWMDLSLFSKTIPPIVDALSKQDPAHAEDYQKNGEALLKTLSEVHEWVKAKVHQVPLEKRYLVTSHDAFNYFARSYLAEESELKDGSWEIRFQAPEGLAPDSQLSSHDIQNILDHLAKFGIQVIFPESNVSQDSIQKIISAGQKKGLNIVISEDPLYGDAMGPPGSPGETYPKMLEHNAEVIEKHLNGRSFERP